MAPDLIADGVADDCTADGARHGDAEVEVAAPAQKAGEEHERFARNDEPGEGGRLGGRAEEDHDVAPWDEAAAECVDEAVGPGTACGQHQVDPTWAVTWGCGVITRVRGDRPRSAHRRPGRGFAGRHRAEPVV